MFAIELIVLLDFLTTGVVMGMETINYRDSMEFLTIKDMEYTLWQTNS